MSKGLRRGILFFWCLLAFCGIRVLAQTSPGFRVIKGAGASVPTGGTITYTLKCENNQDVAVRDVTLSDGLPANVGFVPGSASDGGTFSGRRVTFHLASVGAHASKTVSYRVRVAATVRSGDQIKTGSALATFNGGSTTSDIVTTKVIPAWHAAARGPGGIVFATTSSAAGKIVFISTHDGDVVNTQIYLMNADGSGVTRLTNTDLQHFSPALSADGTKVAFLATPNLGQLPHLYVMNAAPESASNVPLQLTSSGVGPGDPDLNATVAWSPNNRQIVYTKDSSGYITDLTPQSASHTPILLQTTSGRFNGGSNYAFSPDGTQLAFGYSATGTSSRNIFSLKLNVGSDGLTTGSSAAPVQVTNATLNQFAPTWSPDGKRIAFVQANTTSGGGPYDLYTVDVATNAVTRITTDQKVDPASIGWSPDGALLCFQSSGPARDATGKISQGRESIQTLKPSPATDQNGTNFPTQLTPDYFSRAPKFTQVSSLGSGSTAPKLSLSKSVYSISGSTSGTTGTVTPGDVIRYLFTISNTGGAATNVQIVDPVPANTRASVDFTDSSAKHIDVTDGSTIDLTAADGVATYKIPKLAAGETRYAVLSALVNNDAASKATQISNVNYRLTADGGISLTNLPAVTNALRAPLTISKKLALVNAVAYNGTDKVRPGNLLTYNITVSNPSGNGAVAANNLTVTDFIPLGTTFKNVGTGGTFNSNNPPFVSYSIASLAVGASKTLQFSVTVDAAAGTSVVNRDYGTQIEGLNRRFTGVAVTTPVFVAGSLKVTRTATVIETSSTTQVAAGQNIREVVTVTNTGGTAFTGATVKVPVNSETALSKAFLGTVDHPVSGTAPKVDADGKGVFFVLGKIAVGESASVTLETQVKFLTSATSITLDPDGALASDGTGSVISGSDSLLTLKIGGIKPRRPYLIGTVTATLNGEDEVSKVSPSDRVTLKFNYVNAVLNGKGATVRGAFLVAELPSILTANSASYPQIVSSTLPFTGGTGTVTFKLGDIASNAAPGIVKLVVDIPSDAKVGGNYAFNSAFDAANYGIASRDTANVDIVASQKIDLGIGIDGSATSNQPQTPDGRLKPGAVITYQLIGSNSGAGTASGVVLKVPIPAATTYVANSVKISDKFGTIRSGGFGTPGDGQGRITAVTFTPAEALKKDDTFFVSFSIRINEDAPQSLTEIKNAATLSGFGPDGKAQTVTSNTDTQKVFIPAPLPARLALSVRRQGGGARGVPFTTSFTITNTGGETAKAVILRYSFKPEDEFFQSASDGGSPVGVGALPRTIFWDGSGGSQAAQFANLRAHESVTVTLVTKPKNDKSLKVLTGEIAETLQKNTPGDTETNPITRVLPPQYILTAGAAGTRVAGRTATAIRRASGANAFSAIGDFFKFIGASIGDAIFGGSQNVDPKLTKKLQSFDPSSARTTSNAGEDSLALTLKNGRTVTIVPIIAGSLYRIEGPSGVISNDGGSVISNDGGSLVASGGGNALSIDTELGRRSVAQIFSALISQDGGGLVSLSKLISQDGGGLVASNRLISQDGGGFKLSVGASLISQDGGGLVASGGGNLVASGGGNIYNFQGADLHGQMSSSLVASGGGN